MGNGYVTMVIRFDVAPENQAKLVELMSGSLGEVLSRQDGYIDGMILPSDDGTHVLNCTTWRDMDAVQATRGNPEAKRFAELMGAISKPHPVAYSQRRDFPNA
ncbi:antibiotic biosynthesis monooxygenase family protein [Kibdelosporangium persicum]|uniref:Antibiotic biosynthesis monooxygenase n=1 Tax=Kibdelosporangium persicum TaxID=2698649 RepID=A0ABX2FBK2_9PSEU|nr:antibiotic biosynthesis monooxygenase family protein [Kibdelosporangium persicum]NRN68764.1 Antibiotic biosynthesis monooxygenase [Kibdelosporangium persicum]